MKKYRAIFFDWDGTAVFSRTAPVDAVTAAMRPLLDKGVQMAIISGTSYDRIAEGKIETYFTEQELSNLYLGLGRGAYNYAFSGEIPFVFDDCLPDKQTLLAVHDICYAIHKRLLEEFDYYTDIIFSRPNYCKIDLAVEHDRGESLFMQAGEADALRYSLSAHGIKNGMKELLTMAEEEGQKKGLCVFPTCDAKYLEVGLSSKRDNTDAIFERLARKKVISAEECAFWGDEFVGIESGIYGSDSFMMTEKTARGDFFDVSETEGERPDGVERLGGGVERFLRFLREQQ